VGDVVEAVSHGGVLHDVAGVDDVRARGRDLHLDLVPGAGGPRAQTHLGEQLGDALCRLTYEMTGIDGVESSNPLTKMQLYPAGHS